MKNVKMAIAIIVVLSSLAFVITALALIVPIKASAFDSDTMADPNSDVIRYLGDSYDITEAIDSLEFFGAEIEQGQGRADTFVFYNDNVITSIIPKEKFMHAGESLVIGDEWGYYIHTQNESPEHGTNNLRSYVTLFDIEDNTEDESETMDVEIRVLLQNLYITVFDSNGRIHLPDPENDFSDFLRYIPFENKTNGAIVGCFERCPRYYLRDVSVAMSLYNENELNFGDPGYINSEDFGSYFVNMAYGYDGIVWDDVETDIVNDVILPAGELIVDVVLGAITNGSDAIKTFIDINKYAESIGSIASDVVSYTDMISISSSNEILSEAYYANRDDQIKYYNGIIKSAGVIVGSATNGRQLWLGTGDSVEARFQSGHSILNGGSAWYTRVSRELAINIMDVRNGNRVEYGMDKTQTNIHNPIYKQLSINDSQRLYVLPEGDGIDYFKFIPTYNGQYLFELGESLGFDMDNVEVTVYNGSVILSPNNESYLLYADAEYTIKVACNCEKGKIGTLDVGVVELPCSISIEPGEVYIVSLGSIDNKILEFSTENDFIEITEILQIIEQSEISGGAFSNTSSITYAFNGVDGSDYYALLHNKLDVTQTVYPKLSEISAVYVGTDGEMSTEIDCYGTNYSYICLTDVFAGSYVLNLEHETISDYIIYDESFNVLAKDSGVNSHISFTVNTESILYIGIIASTAGTYDVELGYAENAFQWVINEEPIFGNKIYLEQGEGVSAGFMINGTMIDCEIGIDNYNLQNNLYSINIENSNFITVNSNCYIGGSGCTLCVKINGTIIQNSPRLTIIPLLKYPFEGLVDISVDDSNNVIVKWQMVQNLALFRIQLSGSSKVFTIEAGGCIPGQIYEYTINESSFPTVMPILNFDIINIVYSYANEMTGNGEITSEMTYTLNYYFDCGLGTQADPYEIVNERQFKNIEKMAQSNVYYELKNNLDLGNYYMGMDVFYGTLYGNNNTITWGMRYYADDAILNTHALFIENRGRIEKLDVEVDFKTSTKNSSLFSYVGGIVGKNYGTIYYCSVSGSVIDTSVSRHILGGIAAYNASGGWIYETEVRGTFTGTYIIGGISGVNNGQINSCYANCTLTLDVGSNYSAGNAAVGQIAGVNNDYIYGCTVGTDNSGYKIYLDIPSSLRPFAGSIVGAQNVSATELRNCRDMGIMVSISGLSSAQKTNVEKLSGGDIGNEFSGISWN